MPGHRHWAHRLPRARSRGPGPRRRLPDRQRREHSPPGLLPAVDPLQGARRLLSSGAAGRGARRGRGPDALTIRTYIDGVLVQAVSTADCDPLGGPAARRRQRIHDARAGRRARDRRGRAGAARARRTSRRHRDRRPRARSPTAFVAQAGLMRARVAYGGALHEATPDRRPRRRRVRLADGRVLAEEEVVWLPPFEAGTIIALGLNYADHAKELAFNSQDEPLVFLKGPGTLIGHRGATRRPGGREFMHYECELAVVIGRPARTCAARAGDARTSRAIASPTTTRSATIWRTGTGRTCASRIATVRPRSARGWSMPRDVADPAQPRSAHLRQRQADPSRQHARPDLRRPLPDRVSELVHDLERGRCHPHRHAARGSSTSCRAMRSLCEIDGLGRLANTIGADAVVRPLRG